MTKRFCKLNRRDIAANLGEIHRLVSEPKFVCRSCARSSASKSSLCKPSAIPPASCQALPDKEKAACGLLAETIKPQPEHVALVKELRAQKRAAKQQREAVKAQIKVTEPSALLEVVAPAIESEVSVEDKKSLKQAKKALKKQRKFNKKLAKVVKKQQKLLKKQQALVEKHNKLENKFSQINQDITQFDDKKQMTSQLH
ncbi:hypothetical protein [Vibrio maerlii]|uniref:hypothetical protein n=1 Tax=Vibrio maerlii TaxID=2231648 RepID=UPI000E3C921D|nr:hypothetical protein [Vibrio maerlii]